MENFQTAKTKRYQLFYLKINKRKTHKFNAITDQSATNAFKLKKSICILYIIASICMQHLNLFIEIVTNLYETNNL